MTEQQEREALLKRVRKVTLYHQCNRHEDTRFEADLLAALAANVPSGWKLVPEKPTPAMIEALRVATRRDWPSDEVCRVRYAAMLAATPPAPTPEESSVDADEPERRCGGPGCDGNCCQPAPEATPANIRERWNIERDGDALLVCFNDHEKGEGCRYERFVPAAEPAQAQQATRQITLSAMELRDALGFVNPDGPDDADQASSQVTITQREAFTSDDGEAMPAGLYAHLTEYPEEGVYGPLGDAPAQAQQATICDNCGEVAPGCGGLFASDGAQCRFHGIGKEARK